MKLKLAPCLTLLFLPLMASAIAKVTADEAARLGKALTPLGAERAGNAAGTIPAWTGGLPKQDLPRAANPFAAAKSLHKIQAQNMAQHAHGLTDSHEARFKTFPDHKKTVQPTRHNHGTRRGRE